MKKILLLFLLPLSLIAQRNVPIAVKNQAIPEFVLRLEGEKIGGNVTSSAGSFGLPTSASVGKQDFYSRTPATITANYAVDAGYITVPAGRMYVIHGIEEIVTKNCFVQLHIYRSTANTLSGGSGSIVLDGMIEERVKWVKDTAGGTVSWRFDKNPLILRSGDIAAIKYWRSSSTGVNWLLDVDGINLTDDANYTAPMAILGLGDSITGIVSDPGDLKSKLWPQAIVDSFIRRGNEVRLINIAQGGTDTNQWDWWCKQGRIDNIRANLMLVNLGMNDAVSTSGLTAGTGYFKNGLKNIARRFWLNNPGKAVVFNSITASDKSDRSANLAAYRLEIAAVVTELVAEGLPAYFADTSSAYASSNASAYVTAEQGSGNRLHPNASVGQPLMTAIIWPIVKNLLK